MPNEAKHVGDDLFSLRKVFCDDDPFACGQTVGFQDVGRLGAFQVSKGGVEFFTIESTISRGGNVVTLHECLGERLASFQLCALTSGTDDDQFRMLPTVEQVVHKSSNKRGFRPHNNHLDAVFLDGTRDRVVVAYIQLQVCGYVRRSSVAGSNEKLGEEGALGQFPGHGMLSSSRANQQHVHAVKSKSVRRWQQGALSTTERHFPRWEPVNKT